MKSSSEKLFLFPPFLPFSPSLSFFFLLLFRKRQPCLARYNGPMTRPISASFHGSISKRKLSTLGVLTLLTHIRLIDYANLNFSFLSFFSLLLLPFVMILQGSKKERSEIKKEKNRRRRKQNRNRQKGGKEKIYGKL